MLSLVNELVIDLVSEDNNPPVAGDVTNPLAFRNEHASREVGEGVDHNYGDLRGDERLDVVDIRLEPTIVGKLKFDGLLAGELRMDAVDDRPRAGVRTSSPRSIML